MRVIVYFFVWPCICVKLSMKGLQETDIWARGGHGSQCVWCHTKSTVSCTPPPCRHTYTHAHTHMCTLIHTQAKETKNRTPREYCRFSSLAPLCCHHRRWFVSSHLMIGIYPVFYTNNPRPPRAQPLLSDGEMSHLHRFAPLHFC